MLSLLVTLLIIVLVVAVFFWILTMIPIPQPFLNIIRAIVAIIVLIWLIYALVPLAHGGTWVTR